jgi:NitT/TauT family transport system permease protein
MRAEQESTWTPMAIGVAVILIAIVAYGGYLAFELLRTVTPGEWLDIGIALIATLLRVTTAMVVALAWTIPVGFAIGTNWRMARWLQPLVQIAASVPATAFFSAMLVLFLALPDGLNVAAVLLMQLGTQWYLLFNVITGASSIPQDLRHTASLLHLGRFARWRVLILPALFPYIIAGSTTASGGA